MHEMREAQQAGYILERAGASGGWAKSSTRLRRRDVADTMKGVTCNVLLIRMGRCWCGVEHVLATPE